MKNILFLIFFLISYSTYSFAEDNSPIIPAIQTYNKPDDKFQVPLLINNGTQDSTQKIETVVSQEAKEQSLISKKSMTPIAAENDADFKLFLDKKNFLKDNKKEPSLWQGASLVVGFISLLGILAFMMTKIHRKGLFKKPKNESAMNIISTLSINPKRQVMLLQIRDKEIVISNTETGISFIADIGNSGIAKDTPIEKKPFQISNFIKSLPNYEAAKEKQPPEVENKSFINDKKSDILMKALKRIEKEPETEKAPKNDENKPNNNDGSGKFPKYFSNIFENEAKKEVKKKEEPDSVENVTNLIREKLRSMKPLN